MNPHPRLRFQRVVAAGLAMVLASAGTAAAASWTRSTYPKGANGAGPALAVAYNGAAAVLFPAKGKSIGVVSKSSAGAAWSKSAGTWLTGAKAGGVRGPLAVGAVGVAGRRIGALWQSGTGARTLRAAAGSMGRGTSVVRSRRLATPLTGAALIAASGSWLADALWSRADVTGDIVAAGTLPSGLPGAGSTLPPGATMMSADVDGSGTITALLSMGDGSLGVVTRAPGGAWSAVTTVPGTAGGTLLINSARPTGLPTAALAVDEAGDAVVAFTSKADPSTGTLSAGGSQWVIAVSERIGTAGTFGAPIVARGTADGAGAQFSGFDVTVAVSPAVVVVGGSGNPVGTTLGVGPVVSIVAASAAPGQAFAPAGAANVKGSTSNWGEQGLASAANDAGMGAVALWGTGAQGDTEDLGVTTSMGPGQAWSPEVNLAGANVTEGGYTGVSIQPFANGFVAAWSASLTNDAVYPIPRYPIGVATFR